VSDIVKCCMLERAVAAVDAALQCIAQMSADASLQALLLRCGALPHTIPLLLRFDASHEDGAPGGAAAVLDAGGREALRGPAFLGLGIVRDNMQARALPCIWLQTFFPSCRGLVKCIKCYGGALPAEWARVAGWLMRGNGAVADWALSPPHHSAACLLVGFGGLAFQVCLSYCGVWRSLIPGGCLGGGGQLPSLSVFPPTQAARNHHAMLAARALGALCGMLPEPLATPACPEARNALSVLLTEPVACQLAEPDPLPLLRTLNSSVATPQVTPLDRG
jgi:hypothetical protein